MLERLIEKHHILVEDFGLSLEVKESLPDFGGSACLKYQTQNLSIMVTKSRDGVGYDIGNGDLSSDNWYSIDILWNYLQANDEYKKVKSISQFGFIKDNMEWLKEIFKPSNKANTEDQLYKLELKRSKKLFG